MKKFFIEALIITAIISAVVLFASSQYRYDPSPKDYATIIINKHKRADSVGHGRLLLVGGSSISFGIDSKALEDSIHRPVVNFGITVDLGAEFMAGEAKTVVNRDDIVLLMLEYGLYSERTRPIPEVIDYVRYVYPPSRAYSTLSPLNWILLQHRRFVRYVTDEEPTARSTYFSSFNKYGDYIDHLNAPQRTNEEYAAIAKRFARPDLLGRVTHIAAFKALAERCNEVGAHVFIVFPNTPASQYRIMKNRIDEFTNEIRTKIDFIPVLGTPETFLVADNELYDSPNHLNKNGRKRRTETLIQLLHKSPEFQHALLTNK